MIYADWRTFINAIRAIRSSPGRAALWLIFIGMIVLFIWVRSFSHAYKFAQDADRVQADEVISVLGTLLLVVFAIGQNSFGVFRSRVEARFIIGSKVQPAKAIAYLVVRDAVLLLGRFAISISYLLFVTIPRSVGAWQFAADLLFVLVASMTLVCAMLPRRLARGAASTACAAVGYGAAFLVVLPAARDALNQFFATSAFTAFVNGLVPPWHPGRVLLEPNGVWIAVACVCGAISVGVLVVLTRDAYPELYELSTKPIDLREALAGKSGFAARMEAIRELRERKPQAVTSASGAPPGVLIFVWRSLIEFKRRSSRRTIIIGFVFWFVSGYAASRFALTQDSVFTSVFIGGLANALIVLSSTAASALALEMRRPIFWLSPAWLPERLSGFALGQWWPQLARSLVGAAGVALAGETPAIIAIVAIAMPALLALLLATGYAAFALFPDGIDQRGPLSILRILVTYVLIAPPLAFFVILTFMLGQVVAGLAGFALLAVIESLLLLGFSAWRLDGRIDRLAAI